jgi:hypothetical protein
MSETEMPVEETVDIETVEPVDAFDAAADAINGEPVEAVEEAAPVEEEAAPVAEAAPPAPAEPEAPALEPFAFNAFKQKYEVPGLAFDPKARAIVAQDDQSLGRLKQLLSHGREWEMRGRQELVALRREVQTVKETGTAEQAAAAAYLDEWQKMMQLPDDQLVQFIMGARASWPKVQAEATLAHANKLLEQAQRAHEPPEPDVELIVEEASNGAAELVQEILADQPWASPELRAELTQYLQDRAVMNQWVGRATRDMPEIGARRGQYVADWNAAQALVEKYAKPYRDAHAKFGAQQSTAAKQIQQTQSVAVTNAKVQAKPARPAAPPARERSAPPKRETRDDIIAQAFGTWREMQRAR